MKRPLRPFSRATGPAPSILLPGMAAGAWELWRPSPLAGGGPPICLRQGSLEAAAAALGAAETFVLQLPVESGIIQRLALPPAEGPELEEMARLQLEKILPYPPESVGMIFDVIERREAEVIVAVAAVHYDRLVAACEPLTSRGCWPARVILHAQALGGAAAGAETAALICREAGRLILGICERGRLSFAQALGADTPPGSLAAALPSVLLGAELTGIPTSFSRLLLDERETALEPELSAALQVPIETMPAQPSMGRTILAGGDLSPPAWRQRRQRHLSRVKLQRRVLAGAGVYLALLLLGFIGLGVLKLQVARLDAKLAAAEPAVSFVRASSAAWQALAPATQPSHYVAEVVYQVCQCLPPGNTVTLTSFDQTPASLTVKGEAPSPAAAVEFTEKLKARSELRVYHLEAKPPEFLPNGHARFNVSGKLP